MREDGRLFWFLFFIGLVLALVYTIVVVMASF